MLDHSAIEPEKPSPLDVVRLGTEPSMNRVFGGDGIEGSLSTNADPKRRSLRTQVAYYAPTAVPVPAPAIHDDDYLGYPGFRCVHAPRGLEVPKAGACPK